MKALYLATVCGIALITITSLAQAAVVPLESRLGGLAFYDPNLDITWAANANINGPGAWDSQMAWVESLTIGGVSGWRLPSADINGDGTVLPCSSVSVAGCADSEMGFLYWEEGITTSTPGPFSGLQSSYWSGTQDGPVTVWSYFFSSGAQGLYATTIVDYYHAWAVHDGDVGTVPVPAAVWLFGSGLLGLVGVARRKKV